MFNLMEAIKLTTSTTSTRRSEQWRERIAQQAFVYFGCTPEQVLFDNAKSVIVERDAFGEGQHRWNAQLLSRLRACPRACLPCLALVLEPVALAADLHDVHVVQKPVEHGHRQRLVVGERRGALVRLATTLKNRFASSRPNGK